MVNRISRRDFIKLAGFTSVVALWGCTPGVNDPASFSAEAVPTLDEAQKVAGALRRITFGPLPGEVEHARTIGLDAFIEEQLDFSSIADEGIETRLLHFSTLNMTSGELSRLEKKYTHPVAELVRATILRAVYSRRQLYEQMVNFWSDHFNIFILKKSARFLKTIDDREVIRPHAFGNFRDLLSASMHSPAMLVYLDNSTNAQDGPNENYARELLELHTLGANGPYTQADVSDVSRILTGWSVTGLLKDNSGEFLYREKDHDEGAKFVLGVEFPAGQGQRDGEQLIELLVQHPATAAHIAHKLVRRFVSDSPPAELVTRAASTFISTQGDIRSVLRTILHSDEFQASLGLKLKRPFEYVVSALRQTQAETSVADESGIFSTLEKMGQIPFYCATPNGYLDVGVQWLNSNDLLNRWNFALALADNTFVDSRVEWENLAVTTGSVEDLLDQLSLRLLGRVLPDDARAIMLRQVSVLPQQDALLTLGALLLASPYFQYR